MQVIIDGVEYLPKRYFLPERNSTIGTMLFHARTNVGMTLQKLATESGLSKSYIWELEQDKSEPSLRVANKLCQALGINIGDLANCAGKK